MGYVVKFTAAAERDYKRLPSEIQAQIAPRIHALAENPRPVGCKKLAAIKNRWRIRVGDYRIIYDVQDAELIVLIVKIAHRREAYR